MHLANTASDINNFKYRHGPPIQHLGSRFSRASFHAALRPGQEVRVPSHVQHHSVARDQHARGAHFLGLRQHGRVHVGDHDLARAERGEFFAELRPVHVPGDGARVLVAFDDEQIRAGRDGNERIRNQPRVYSARRSC